MRGRAVMGALLSLCGAARAQPVSVQPWQQAVQVQGALAPAAQVACPASGTSLTVPLMVTYRRLDPGGEACRGRAPLSGVHLAFWNSTNGAFGGVQLAVVNANAMDDSDMTGLQLGVLNVAGWMYGAQLGAVNVASRSRGLQLGAINVAHRLEGVQIGLLNIATTHRPVPFMILLNVGLSGP